MSTILITSNLLSRKNEAGHEERGGHACYLQGPPFLMGETRAIQKAKRKLTLAWGPETSPSSREEGGHTGRWEKYLS